MSILLLLVAAGTRTSLSQTIDPHELYERKCAGCHVPHAREFADERLERLGDKTVLRRSGTDLRSFLAGGHGRLAPDQADALASHLEFVVAAGGVYRQRCYVCHGRAVALARSRLALSDGAVVGRFTDRDIATFLEYHGRLEEDQIPIVVQMLERQLTTRPDN